MVEINDVEMKDGEKPADGEPEVKKDQDVLTIEGTRHNIKEMSLINLLY